MMKAALALLGVSVVGTGLAIVMVSRRSEMTGAPLDAAASAEVAALSAQHARMNETTRLQAEDNARLRKILEMEVAEKRRAESEIDALWAKYDAGPKGKAALMATTKKGFAIVETVPIPALQQQARVYNAAASRRRMAPLFNADARAEGPDADVLVPSHDHAKCVVMGSMWGNDGDTAEAAASLGFTKIRCRAAFSKNPMTGQVVTSEEREWDVRP
jgi:hypothetical protein